MNLICQKNLSRILLISFFLQSCGIEVPISGHQPARVGPDGVQQLGTTDGGSAAPPLSTEKPQGQLQPSLAGPHDKLAQILPETAKRYVGPITLQEEIAADKQELRGLQTYARAEADELAALLNQRSTPQEERANEAAYIQRSRALFHDISGRFKAFLARIFHESQQKLGPTPCQYTVMGLGSMALQQMLPYSDVAFAILIEESSDQEAASAYFKQLTHLVHFRVSNKTLLERQEEPYTLIKTVSEMLYYLKNEGSQVAHIDKDLPYILENTCHVHGDKQLYEAYETQKMAFLSDPAIYKPRAIKRILEGTVEWDYSHLSTVNSHINGLGNPGQFSLQFGPEDGDTLYMLKQEIRHLSDRLLYGLALYHGIVPGSGWDAVVQLCERSVICREAVPHLSYALSFAHMLRLRTCLHDGQQQEPVTVLSGLPQEQVQIEISKALCLPQEELGPGSSLFRYYYTVLPLYRKIRAFLTQLDIHIAPTSGLSTSTLTLNQEVEADFFVNNGFTFYDTSVITMGNIHHRLSQWESAKNCYEKALKIQRILHGNAHPSVARTLHSLGAIHMASCDYIESRACYSEALQILKQVYAGAHPGIASAFHNLGTAHSASGQYAQGLVYYLGSLRVSKKVYGDTHPAVVNTLNCLGAVWSFLGEYDQSLTHYVESLGIGRLAYGNIHPVVASTLNNLGAIQSALGAYVPSRAYYMGSLNMSKQLYGDQHPTIASILNNLGNTDNALGEHMQSIQYSEEALRIYKQAYGEPHTHATVLTLNSLGTAYQALGEYTQGIQYYKEALAISKEAYEDKYPGVVSTLKGLFLLWEQSGCQDALHTLAGFLKTHMYKLHYTGVLASMASEVLQDTTLADAEAAKSIRLARMCKLLRLVDAAPREILGLQHLMLQLRLVNEWLLLCQGEDEEQQGVTALEEEFRLGEKLSTWVKQSSLKYNDRYHHDTALARAPSAVPLALLSTCSSVARCYKAELMKETLSMYFSQFENDAPDAHRAMLSGLKSSVAIDLFEAEILPLLQLAINSRDCMIRQDTLEIFCALAKRGISVDHVISSLCKALQDDDPKVRLAALASLRSLLENDVLMKSQILPILRSSIHASDVKIREMTVEIFCSLVARDAHVQVFLSLLKQPLSNSKLELHHDVLRVLASSVAAPAPEATPHILNALGDSSYMVRSAALKALPTLVVKGLAISEVLSIIQRALKGDSIYTVLE
ncbi:MAG: tetratricopeptide repeat protein, partial [Bacteroidota bacterium]